MHALLMCCRCLRSTHVNVVSGSNGSGKSAVLQAMQCALGAQARKTGRADKNSELVRTGCHEAKVQVRRDAVMRQM
jgi:chromosome segregation ATPase